MKKVIAFLCILVFTFALTLALTPPEYAADSTENIQMGNERPEPDVPCWPDAAKPVSL